MLQAGFLLAVHHNEEQPALQLQYNDSLPSYNHSDDAEDDHCHTHYHKTLTNWAEIDWNYSVYINIKYKTSTATKII